MLCIRALQRPLPEEYPCVSIHIGINLGMNFKICSKCKIKKKLKDFYFRKSGKRSGTCYEKCKECMKTRGRSYYHINHDRQLKLAILRRNKTKDQMRKFLIIIKDEPCADCKQKYPSYVMDFDHRHGKKKEHNIARMIIGGWSKTKIEKEIKKCDIVCANCHRIRTYSKLAGLAKVVTAGA